jgi:hypothetical protein
MSKGGLSDKFCFIVQCKFGRSPNLCLAVNDGYHAKACWREGTSPDMLEMSVQAYSPPVVYSHTNFDTRSDTREIAQSKFIPYEKHCV